MPRGYGSIPTVESLDISSNLPPHVGVADDISAVVGRRQTSKVILSMIAAVLLFGYASFQVASQKEAMSKTAASFKPYHFLGKSLTSPRKAVLLDNSMDAKPLWHDQYVDHIGQDTEHSHSLKTYKQRFLKKSEHFQGPGHPILVIVGGEGPIDPPMLYQFVYDGLAEEFGAFVLEPEHRFYGESYPVKHPEVKDFIKYLTPDQALADAVNLIQYAREELGCSIDPTSPDYCPVITFGGSYPGFLSFALRYRYSDYIDAAYASSAPLHLYSQVVNSNSYFDKITEVSDGASPGCADAVKSTMFAVRDDLLANFTKVKHAAKATGICVDTLPNYFTTVEQFVDENLVYFVPAVFADLNMGYYPPGPETYLVNACEIFQNTDRTPMERISDFYRLRGEIEEESGEDGCLDLSKELPAGPHARIRGSDNSGSGGGETGQAWEFQCCKDLIVRAGYSEESMFIPRPFSYEWHKEHCKRRFPGVPVEPFRMAMEWMFNDLSESSRIIFGNGLHDGWSTSSILSSDNPNIAVLNFPNGAHHSEFRRMYPDPIDTADIIQGHEDAKQILGEWLDEIRTGHSAGTDQ